MDRGGKEGGGRDGGIGVVRCVLFVDALFAYCKQSKTVGVRAWERGYACRGILS